MKPSTDPSTENAAELPPIGHYQLLDSIGRGGMGLVYRARDTRLGREVAIKCLRTELFEPHYRERFRREALLLAKLNHPHIVHIYDFIETDDRLALVMELIDGQNLQLHLREHIVPISQRMQWLIQIAQGLAVAHDAGIIHRDLKAENVLINKHRQAKISDLGIAKSQDFNATLTDHVAGSYCSMSPEQAMGEALDFKSDLFSFGILAYQLLCGAHPFGETENKLQLMQRIISHPPIAPTKRNPDLPPEICTLLGQLLSKNPDNRPDNTHWVAAQLEKLSELVVDEPIVADATQALPHALNTGSDKSKSGLKNTRIKMSSDHPTFDTRFMAGHQESRARNFVKKNKLALTLACLALMIASGITMWQLQPKPPKYVAVIPPSLNTEAMHASQQELVKAAVNDALEQSVIQMEGYFLIPRNEIVDINGDIEMVRRATAADELITADIECKVEACTIRLSRLAPESNAPESRLRVLNGKRISVLTDNYLLVAQMVQSNISGFYSKKSINFLENIDENEYLTILNVSRDYRDKGADHSLLESLDALKQRTKLLPTAQMLYREVALDLYHDTKDPLLLDKVSAMISLDSTSKNTAIYLSNLYSLQVARREFDGAIETTRELSYFNPVSYELHARLMLAKGDYAAATVFYKKALDTKYTANNLFNLANAYWYAGDITNAKRMLGETFELSPNLYKAHGLNGLISLFEGNIDNAIISFSEVVAQKPDDSGTLTNLGLCYILQKNYTKAVDILNQALLLAPNHTTYMLNVADVHNLRGDTDAAEVMYTEIIAAATSANGSIENLRNRAQAYAHLKRINDALTDLKELERKDPQNIETTYTGALIHTLAGNDPSALLSIENALKGGMDGLWFGFSWFDRLCGNEAFISIMQTYGEPDRCAPQEQ